MASTLVSRPRPRPAHTPGPTRCVYTPDGTKLVTAGSNNTIRVFKTGSDGEPANVDNASDENLALSASNEFFVAGTELGDVSLYSLATNEFETLLFKCTVTVRDVALSPDSKWCAIAGDELTVKLVNPKDITVLQTLQEHGQQTKHLSFDPKGSLLALSCPDGVIYIYSMTSDKPEVIRKIHGMIGKVATDSGTSTKVAWHPDGRAFAVPTPLSNVQVVSKTDWAKQRSFANEHESPITALAWSPNGAMLATAAKDGKLLIWATEDQTVIARLDYPNVVDIAWHPTKNLAAFTTTNGEVYIYDNFVPEQFTRLLDLPLQPAPFYHDPLKEIPNNVRRPELGARKQGSPRPRRDSLGSIDDLLDDGLGGGFDDDFVVDDDGAGYALNGNRKRPAHDDDALGDHPHKRLKLMHPRYHDAFQPSSTPWRGNRKYLCLNMVGFVWTVDQDSHNTITVEFYDHEFHRDFHFTDTFLYDKACLNEQGTLFSCPPTDARPATLFYRPHETWTQRTDWRTELPKGETVLAMSLSESFITVLTSADYVRVFTLFGIPYRVTRAKSTPMVSCASWRDYVMTIGNGSMGGDGTTRLSYTIENMKRDEICQNEDTVALPQGATLQNVFFSDKGDPCIYDSTGVLLTLMHWRLPSRAYWVPLLDTKLLARLASGRKKENYYPVAVADNKFHCIILKGGDQHPYFPRPLLSEFEFSIPLTSRVAGLKKKSKSNRGRGNDLGGEDENMDDGGGSSAEEDYEDAGVGADEDPAAAESRMLEHTYLLRGLQATQLADLVDASARTTSATAATQRAALQRLELDVDKALLQLLAIECREGEERGMRALEMVRLFRDRSGRMLEAAGKVAQRYGRSILGDKIREEGERELASGRNAYGDDDDDDDL